VSVDISRAFSQGIGVRRIFVDLNQQDGTIQLEIKLTGILNTYSIKEGEDTNGWGTEVYPGKQTVHADNSFTDVPQVSTATIISTFFA